MGHIPPPPRPQEHDCVAFYDELTRVKLIQPLDAFKVCEALRLTTLPPEQLGRLLKWFGKMQRTHAFADAEAREAFKQSVCIRSSPLSPHGSPHPSHPMGHPPPP